MAVALVQEECRVRPRLGRLREQRRWRDQVECVQALIISAG